MSENIVATEKDQQPLVDANPDGQHRDIYDVSFQKITKYHIFVICKYIFKIQPCLFINTGPCGRLQQRHFNSRAGTHGSFNFSEDKCRESAESCVNKQPRRRRRGPSQLR